MAALSVRALPRLRQPLRAGAYRWASSDASTSKPPAPPASAAPTSSTEPATASSSKAEAPPTSSKPEIDPYAVPPLPRPLGTPFKPSSRPLTRQEKIDKLLDQDRRMKNRKALVKEATQGYFHDYNLARKANGGKLWLAPPVLIREDRALYFPDIEGKALTGEVVHTTDLFKGKISLVSILNTRISEEHIQSFVEPVLEDWEGQPIFNYLQINHQANPLKSMLLSFFMSSLKRTIPEDRWGTYIISTGEWSEIDVKEPLGLENKLLGYVFLVDENGKVRWAGCGAAQGNETEDLRRAAAVLLRRATGDIKG